MKIKYVLIALLSVAATGCVSKDLVNEQVEELKALDNYHAAQRKQNRAKKAVTASSVALQLSKLDKLAADKEVEKTKEELDTLLGK